MNVPQRWMVALGLALPLMAANRLSVTVVDAKTGKLATGLTAEDFTLYEDKLARKADQCVFASDYVDVMLLIDTSLTGDAVRPLADALVAQLKPKERISIVGLQSGIDLIQDFTADRKRITRGLDSVTYGTKPHLIDALYEAIDTGFKTATARRVVLLLTSAYEGDSRMEQHALYQLARTKAVSVYPVYVTGKERGIFERIAQRTGGAIFSLKEMKKQSNEETAATIFEAMRGHYTITVPGNLELGEKLRVEIGRQGKWFASALPLTWE
jgi:hypothetical protein